MYVFGGVGPFALYALLGSVLLLRYIYIYIYILLLLYILCLDKKKKANITLKLVGLEDYVFCYKLICVQFYFVKKC